MTKREMVPASEEHQREFPKQFRLKKEYADNPECQLAFEHASKYCLYPEEISYIGQVIERIDDGPKVVRLEIPPGPADRPRFVNVTLPYRLPSIEIFNAFDPRLTEHQRLRREFYNAKLGEPWTIDVKGELQADTEVHYFGPPELLPPQMIWMNLNLGEHYPPIPCPSCGGSPVTLVMVRPVEGHKPTRDELRELAESICCPLCDGVGYTTPQRYGWYLVGKRFKHWRMKKMVGLREAAEQWGILPSLLCHIENGTENPTQHPYWREAISQWQDLESSPSLSC